MHVNIIWIEIGQKEASDRRSTKENSRFSYWKGKDAVTL